MRFKSEAHAMITLIAAVMLLMATFVAIGVVAYQML